MTNAIKIGSISACIAGDHRYTSYVTVTMEGDQVTVTLSENGACGGMDGPGGSTPFAVTNTVTCPAKAPDIVKAVKQVMDSTIKRYGKPTKNFNWVGVRERGLSQRLAIKALSFQSE